jgi:peptidyl-tRNA hydrolase, PTH1 family
VTRLIVGLGNPGPEYAWTPHNLGFHVVERLALEQGLIFEPAARLEGWTGRRDFEVARHPVRDALLVKPSTFVNLSGRVVAPLAAWCGTAVQDVFVVYDDLDLDFGVLRIRPHGGAGGHNGMRSIIAELGSDQFPRLRVGVGRPRTDAARHVLSELSPAQRSEAEITVAEAAAALAWWLAEGDLEKCMTRFHSRWKEGPTS